MIYMGVDPGPYETAWFCLLNGKPCGWGKEPNETFLGELPDVDPPGHIYIFERVVSFGMPVGEEIFSTVFWTARYYQRLLERKPGVKIDFLTRPEIKLHLCNSARAKDPNVRQVLLDRFGGKIKALGTAKQPGPLRGVAGDCWSAMAVAITYWEKHK